MGPLVPLLAGFGTGASLIVAIGAQNAYVLRVGLSRRHVFAVVAICALSDIILIALGIAGMGALVRAAPVAIEILRWVGAAFLLCYAVFAASRAIHPTTLQAATSAAATLGSVVLTSLALTWLNPHVYLDTLLFLGSVAATHGEHGRWYFGAGAATASVVWFALIGYGARLLGPVFARPLAWRILDAAIAVLMLVLAVTLLTSR
jgi:L-lysine exporter family protein LysE/ArgO